MTVPIPGLSVVIRCAADYGQTRKERFPTWSGLQWSSSGASALPKQPPSSVQHPLPFTVCPGSPLLTRSPCHLWQGDRNTVLPAKPYGLFYFPYCPFPCFLPPLMCVFHRSIWEPLFLNGKFISVDGYERVPVFALCAEKNNAGWLRCPQHFLSSKTFLNPSFLLVVCRKKKAHKLRWGMKAQKKVGRKKRPSRKGFLKKGL